jgi:hypothetical protein
MSFTPIWLLEVFLVVSFSHVEIYHRGSSLFDLSDSISLPNAIRFREIYLRNA